MDLGKLLRPKSVAMVGASDNAASMNGNITKKILDSSIPGPKYLVNPKYDTLLGMPCYKSVLDLPTVPDCVAICLNCKLSQNVLEEAGQKGVKGAIVFASGYAEVTGENGKVREQELIDICKKYDMALCGPNCAGFVNDRDGFRPYGPVITCKEKTGTGLSLISQSGGVTIDVYDNPYVRVSYAISAGNCSVVGLEDYMDYLLDDVSTEILGMYIEGVRHPARFAAALRKAAEAGKPVVILKGGRSAKGGAVAGSHTGSLAGSSATFEAVCRRYGVILVDSLAEFRSTVAVLAAFKGRYPKNLRLASINRSGANATLCADLAEQAGVEIPDFASETVEKLRALLPDFATVHNPLDGSSGLSSVEGYVSIAKTAAEDPRIDAIAFTIAEFMQADKFSVRTLDAVRAIRAAGVTKPILMIPNLEDSRRADYWQELYALDATIVSPGLAGYRMIRNLADFFRYSVSEHTMEISAYDGNQKDAPGRFLTEWDSKRALKAEGFPVPPQKRVQSRSELREALADMAFPLAMKISSEDIPHKTEAGGVRLNVTASDAETAFDAILDSCKRFAPTAKLDGVIVSSMARKGLELILGVKNDPQFGPMLLVGLGGVFVDVFKDCALAPCPICESEALSMLQSLKSFPLLTGYRGSRPCDIDAIVKAMVLLSDIAAKHRDEIEELDINPLLVYPEGEGVAMLDALIRLKEDGKPLKLVDTL